MAEITDQMEKLVEKAFHSIPFPLLLFLTLFISHLISLFFLLVKHGSRDNTTEGQLV